MTTSTCCARSPTSLVIVVVFSDTRTLYLLYKPRNEPNWVRDGSMHSPTAALYKYTSLLQVHSHSTRWHSNSIATETEDDLPPLIFKCSNGAGRYMHGLRESSRACVWLSAKLVLSCCLRVGRGARTGYRGERCGERVLQLDSQWTNVYAEYWYEAIRTAHRESRLRHGHFLFHAWLLGLRPKSSNYIQVYTDGEWNPSSTLPRKTHHSWFGATSSSQPTKINTVLIARQLFCTKCDCVPSEQSIFNGYFNQPCRWNNWHANIRSSFITSVNWHSMYRFAGPTWCKKVITKLEATYFKKIIGIITIHVLVWEQSFICFTLFIIGFTRMCRPIQIRTVTFLCTNLDSLHVNVMYAVIEHIRIAYTTGLTRGLEMTSTAMKGLRMHFIILQNLFKHGKWQREFCRELYSLTLFSTLYIDPMAYLPLGE